LSKEVSMIVSLARTIDPFTFARKYPKAHVILGRFDPRFASDEEASGEPTLLTVLMMAQNTLGLVGECTGTVDVSSATMRLSYALAEDAARVCRLVNATPVKSGDDCFWMASFPSMPASTTSCWASAPGGSPRSGRPRSEASPSSRSSVRRCPAP
jgi:hypothetical protein